ncbi:Tetratricopeptide repeat protein [Streptobacillus felis]
MNRLLIIQNNELFLNNDDVIKSNDILENILKEYEKSFFNINIKDLEIYKERYKKNIDEIKLKLDNRYVNIEKLINDDIIKSLEEIKFLRDEYLKLGLKNEVEYLNRFEKEVDEKINILEEKMKNNFSQHNSYYNNKEYTTAISYLEKSLYFANLLNNEEKKKEIEGKIRLIYKKKKNIENENIKKNEKTLDKEKLEFEIKKSIKLSIEKGDDYLKNDEYEKAFIEYKRALELMGKVNYSKNIRKEVEKKLQYINKKKDKKWWELWK